MTAMTNMLKDTMLNFTYIGKSWVNLNTKHLSFEEMHRCESYVSLSMSIYNAVLLLFFMLFFMNLMRDLFIDNTNVLSKFFAALNSMVIVLSMTLLLVKTYLALKMEKILGPHFYITQLQFYEHNKNLGMLEHFASFSTSFSDSMALLSVIVGMICLDILGSKNLLKTFSNLTVFFLFNVFVIIMVSTQNLLMMFLSFEFMFLPTVYFAYSLGYSKKMDKASQVLFMWTLFGSFLVLCCLAYMYYKYGTLSYLQLTKKTFTETEMNVLTILVLVGFGMKMPLAPFHFWLLKVHVESPTAFSMFLSGFLVKSAFYCLFMLMHFLSDSNVYLILLVWILYSLLMGTLGLARQTDVKKLIAWATIQEMSFILLFLVFKQVFMSQVCVIFLMLHGLMSSYMFYLVDILQRSFKTRSIHLIKGLNLVYPDITKYIWFLIFLFSGFPFTVKFFIEWNLVSLALTTNYTMMMITLLIVNFLGVVFFCKMMFIILYGTPDSSNTPVDFMPLQQKESAILYFLSFMMLYLLLIVFLIKWQNKNLFYLTPYDD